MKLESIINPPLHKTISTHPEPDLKIPFEGRVIHVLYQKPLIHRVQGSPKAVLCLPGNGVAAHQMKDEFSYDSLVPSAHCFFVGYAKENAANAHLVDLYKGDDASYNHVTLQLAMFKAVFQYLIQEKAFAVDDITIHGYSLGGFFAMKLASVLWSKHQQAPKLIAGRSFADAALIPRYIEKPRIFNPSAASVASCINHFSIWKGNVTRDLIDADYPIGRIFVYAANGDRLIVDKASQLEACRQNPKFPQSFARMVTLSGGAKAGHCTPISHLEVIPSSYALPEHRSKPPLASSDNISVDALMRDFVSTPVIKLEALAREQLAYQKTADYQAQVAPLEARMQNSNMGLFGKLRGLSSASFSSAQKDKDDKTTLSLN